jgi:cell surface protein SprA
MIQRYIRVEPRFSSGFHATSRAMSSMPSRRSASLKIRLRRGISRRPDTEDLNGNGTLDTENAYYEYRLPLSRERLNEMAESQREPGDFIVERIGANQDWYLVRIPVRNYTDRIGNIQDFSLIRAIRMWTTGHASPMTMRFARLELVGSQWQKSEQALSDPDFNPITHTETGFTVESINDEENVYTYVSPSGMVMNQMRGADGTPIQQREQAMLMRIEQMYPHSQRAVFRSYSQGLDLLKYSNLRMFSHFNGRIAGQEITDNDKLTLFVRLGSNESADFYEYEQPLTPSPPGTFIPGQTPNRDAVWQTNQLVNGQLRDLNSVNIVLGTLNQLKVVRDNSDAPMNEIYWSDVNRGRL